MIFLDIKSEDLFDRMVKQGLPVIVIGTQYYGHTESLEEYFKYRTMKRIGDSYDGAE